MEVVLLETGAERRDMGNLERAEKGEKKSRRSTRASQVRCRVRAGSNTIERKEAESEPARTFKRQMGKEARSARRFGDFFSNKARPPPKATKMDQGQCRIPSRAGVPSEYPRPAAQEPAMAASFPMLTRPLPSRTS